MRENAVKFIEIYAFTHALVLPDRTPGTENRDILLLGHQNKCHINNVTQEEFNIKVEVDTETCEGCTYGKAHKLKFGTRERAAAPGELIHDDVCGPFETQCAKGYRYFVLFKTSVEIKVYCARGPCE